MGMWTKLFGGAEGCHQAMRESYERHFQLARDGRNPTTDPPHNVGLFGALASRYRARGTPIDEAVIWSELAPFLLMEKFDGVEALAEYVMLQERPNEARTGWLTDRINVALRSCHDDSLMAAAALALMNRVAWCGLLEPSTLRVIEQANRLSMPPY